MEQDLISKKELLELTGISYGQLYRWKRKNLIPEDWFVKKASFTGQETFFPKSQIIARIDKIKNMKEDLSLDDLADMFSPDLVSVLLTKQELMELNIVSKTTLEFFIKQQGDMTSINFEQILFIYVLDKLFRAGEISLDEGEFLLRTLSDSYQKFTGKSCDLIFLRKLGIATCFLILNPHEIYFENSAKVIAQLNLGNCVEELKMKLN
jgi:predicted DNA-binding transcriptional regulator AlpA